jgi:hypothetical protein
MVQKVLSTKYLVFAFVLTVRAAMVLINFQGCKLEKSFFKLLQQTGMNVKRTSSFSSHH